MQIWPLACVTCKGKPTKSYFLENLIPPEVTIRGVLQKRRNFVNSQEPKADSTVLPTTRTSPVVLVLALVDTDLQYAFVSRTCHQFGKDRKDDDVHFIGQIETLTGQQNIFHAYLEISLLKHFPFEM